MKPVYQELEPGCQPTVKKAVLSIDATIGGILPFKIPRLGHSEGEWNHVSIKNWT